MNLPDSKPIQYADELASHYGAMGHPSYDWTIHQDAPLHQLIRPVNECRVTLLTSGGISQCTMPAWDSLARNDHRLDAIPVVASSDDFQIHDAYYDHSDAEQDLNCQFPIDRLNEMSRAGEIGSVAKRFWSGFMGRIYNRSKVLGESGPAFAAELHKDEVDLLIAVPA